jgi:signal transduction histidine kinase
VTLAIQHGRLEIEVRDDGSKNPGRLAETGAGLGLVGVRERVESTGGTLDAGAGPDGSWRLSATLPVLASSRPLPGVAAAGSTPRG